MSTQTHILAFARSLVRSAGVAIVALGVLAGSAAASEPRTSSAPLSVSVTVKAQCGVRAAAPGSAQAVTLDCAGGAAPVVTTTKVQGSAIQVATILF